MVDVDKLQIVTERVWPWTAEGEVRNVNSTLLHSTLYQPMSCMCPKAIVICIRGFYCLLGFYSFNVSFKLGSVMQGLLVFLVANSFFAILDLTGRPQWLVKYKIQDEKTLPVS